MRKELDFYPTPNWYTYCLKDFLGSLNMHPKKALEPFAGDGAIVRAWSDTIWVTNDVAYYGYPLDFCCDLSQSQERSYLFSESTDYLAGEYIYLITNPPYNLIKDINVLKWLTSFKVCCLLLRQNFLNTGSGKEGISERGIFLSKFPPTHLVIMPRIPMSKGKNGRPQTDSCNHAWIIWDNTGNIRPGVSCYTSETVAGWDRKLFD